MITINSDEHDFGDIMIMALRYALGRRTYATLEVSEFIRENKQYISERVREVMLRDLKDYFASRKLGRVKDDGCDYASWTILYEFLKKLNKKEVIIK